MNVVSQSEERDGGWGVTFAFWGTLLVAGALFAVVSLAPKLKRLAELDAKYAENQLRLVELERQAIELEKVAEAIEHDPAFAAELARLEFAAGSDGERIDVPAELRLGAGEDAAEPATAAVKSHWSVPPEVLGPLATHRGLRATLLATAAVLVLVAFVFLNEEQAATVQAVVRTSKETARGVAERYRKAA